MKNKSQFYVFGWLLVALILGACAEPGGSGTDNLQSDNSPDNSQSDFTRKNKPVNDFNLTYYFPAPVAGAPKYITSDSNHTYRLTQYQITPPIKWTEVDAPEDDGEPEDVFIALKKYKATFVLTADNKYDFVEPSFIHVDAAAIKSEVDEKKDRCKVTITFKPTPIPPISNLNATLAGKAVTLTWKNPPTSDKFNYNIEIQRYLDTGEDGEPLKIIDGAETYSSKDLTEGYK
jgi:hypothetical protein